MPDENLYSQDQICSRLAWYFNRKYGVTGMDHASDLEKALDAALAVEEVCQSKAAECFRALRDDLHHILNFPS